MPEIPFAHQWTICENQLLLLRDSFNGKLFSTSVTNILEFEYYLSIYPNGYSDGSRGQTSIGLHLEFKNVKEVKVEYTFIIESANYSHTFHQIYEKSGARGIGICGTDEFFDPKKKFFVDGKFTVKVNGIFKFENEDDVILVDIDAGQQNWNGGELGDELWINNGTKDFKIITLDGNEINAKVESYLISQISAATVCRLTNCSTLTNSSKLKEKCITFLMAAFGSKTPLDDIDELEKDILLEMPEIPFAHQWQIAENRLLPLKDSVNGYLLSSPVTNIPEFEYYLKIYPNGDGDERRGETWIFLILRFKNVKKVETDFNFIIESSNFSTTNHYVYEKQYGWGIVICTTEELFDPEKKFIVDGKFIVKVNGIFKFEPRIAYPAIIEQNWIGGELGDELWNNNETKNYTIITADDGKEIKVHKFILRNRSEFFKQILNICATDSSVEITEFSFKVVETAFKIIYNCNFTSSLSIDELMSLLQFFDKYLLPALKAKVEPYLIDQISPSNVVLFTNFSIQTNSFKLKEKCMEFLMICFKQQTALANFDDLDKDMVFEIVKNSLYSTL